MAQDWSNPFAMTNVLLTLIYAMLSATAAIVLNIFGVTTPATAILIGAIGFLFASQIHASILRRREKTQSRREIAKPKQVTREIVVALEETHAKIAEVKSAADAKT